ncbi:MAG: hypothetical protein WCY19_06110 [Candidatus Gastranaerophilaceae bacterium]
MGLKNFIENKCNLLGQKNKAVYTVVSIALFKGIFRPIFTMNDKKQDPKSRKYAAIREGATELIAVPTYILLSWATEKLAPKFAFGDKSIVEIFDRSKSNAKSTLGFLGVCLAALVVIPGLCNLAMPHILKAFGHDGKKTDNVKKPYQIPEWAAVPPQNLQAPQPTKITPANLNIYKPISPKSGMGVSL